VYLVGCSVGWFLVCLFVCFCHALFIRFAPLQLLTVLDFTLLPEARYVRLVPGRRLLLLLCHLFLGLSVVNVGYTWDSLSVGILIRLYVCYCKVRTYVSLQSLSETAH
jgi:hypothetical protein